MAQLHSTARFNSVHPALAAKVSGIASSLFVERDIHLSDAGDAMGHGVALAAAAQSRITRSDSGERLLRYVDPVAESTFAALVACIGEAGGPVAADPESLSVLALADRLAVAEIPVLIGGPTGTGKEVLARFIHARSPRSSRPFVAVNCAAIPETMLEAMLFGHRKGAFTGASGDGEGFFQAADGGTLLLDEIAEMPLALQAKLLRALQESEVVPVGATTPIKVDVRIIASANRDLPHEVEQGRFREDLFYRLNVFPIGLRALRERPADIAPLAFAMVLRHHDKGKPVPWLSDVALAMLRMHGWPGNVRELENVIRRALLLAGDAPEIGPDHIAFDRAARAVEDAGTAAGGQKLSRVVQISEARAIMQTLDACGGKRAEAAKRLGISERTLRYRLASFREAGIAIGGGQS